MLHCTLIASLIAALACGTALAQDVKVYRAEDCVDPRDVAAILNPSKPIKMRSIRLLGDAPAQPTALALPVQFAFDSSNILSAARTQLDGLAQGIRLLPADKAVVIEGHTDAKGSDNYNEKLSQRRAQAVKRYLVAQHGIEPRRLRAVGFGEYRPLPGSDALAPENRRVQFRGE